MSLRKELSIETMEKIVKLIQEGNLQWSVVEVFSFSQSAGSKIWWKYKRNKVVKKGKYTGRLWKTSECQDRKLKEICLENRRWTRKQFGWSRS